MTVLSLLVSSFQHLSSLVQKQFQVQIFSLPYHNIFLADNSDKGWGKRCNKFGCNCKGIINQFDWVNFVNLNNFDSLENDIDLLYLDNTLDHIDNPFVTLSKISPKVKNIYIKFNPLDFGIQHPFFLKKETINFIASELNFKIKNLENENQYLLSK